MILVGKHGYPSRVEILFGAPSSFRRLLAFVFFCASTSVGVAIADPVSVLGVLPFSAYSSVSGPLTSTSGVLNYTYNSTYDPVSGGSIPIMASIAETATQLSADLSSGPRTGGAGDSPFLNTGSVIELSVSGPTYLSESLSVSYIRSTNDQTPTVYSLLEFQDLAGNLIGAPCGRPTTTPPTLSGEWTCSTGPTYFSGPETIYVSSILNVKEEGTYYTDQSSVEAAASVGDLQVTDASGNVIETINLNNPISTPEPGGLPLSVMSIAMLMFARKRATRR